jgi:AcrR family transcriptional regulator
METATEGPRGVRERNRVAIEREILRVGRLHLARVGAAALSLRAIARDLGMVSSAVYRYVANRDDLLTLLIVAAYDDLGDAVDAALEEVAEEPARPRFVAVCHAVRRWALAHPHEYALIYGSPVPDYHAPAERTTTPGTRVTAHLVDLLGGAPAGLPSGDPAALAGAAAALRPLVSDDAFFADRAVEPEALVRGLAAWSLVLGALSAELFEQLGPDTVADPEAHFAAMAALAADVAFGPVTAAAR